MIKRILLAFLLCAGLASPSLADQTTSGGAQGNNMRGTNTTGQGDRGMGGLSTWIAGPQSTVWQRAGFGQLAGPPKPTVLDSFVKSSGYNDMIYGDESVEGPPPYFDFLPIGAGISSGGLTTGNQFSGQDLNGIRPGLTAAEQALLLDWVPPAPREPMPDRQPTEPVDDQTGF